MRGKSRMGLVVCAGVLVLLAALLVGFTFQDHGGPAPTTLKADQGGVAQALKIAAPEASGSAQGEHVQTYVYWPVWRSGS